MVDLHDRRLALLYETPEGIAVWKDCMQAFRESSAEFTALLSEYQVKNAIKLLKKCKGLLKATLESSYTTFAP